MLVRDLMTTAVRTIRSDATIEEAFGILKTWRIHQLPVVEAGKVVGIVTDRDLRGPDGVDHKEPQAARGTTVADVMTVGANIVSPDTPLVRAARLLLLRGVGALPVVEDGELVGILTRSDLLLGLVQLLDRKRAVSARTAA